MSVKVCLLQRVETLDDFFDSLEAQLDLPPHFGRNLDALYDTLSHDLAGPIEIVWRNTSEARQALGSDMYTTLLSILETAASERGDLTLDIKH
jgi:ribonuclease inhibitor